MAGGRLNGNKRLGSPFFCLKALLAKAQQVAPDGPLRERRSALSDRKEQVNNGGTQQGFSFAHGLLVLGVAASRFT